MCQMPHYFLAASSEFSVQLLSGKKVNFAMTFPTVCLVQAGVGGEGGVARTWPRIRMRIWTRIGTKSCDAA